MGAQPGLAALEIGAELAVLRGEAADAAVEHAHRIRLLRRHRRRRRWFPRLDPVRNAAAIGFDLAAGIRGEGLGSLRLANLCALPPASLLGALLAWLSFWADSDEIFFHFLIGKKGKIDVKAQGDDLLLGPDGPKEMDELLDGPGLVSFVLCVFWF